MAERKRPKQDRKDTQKGDDRSDDLTPALVGDATASVNGVPSAPPWLSDKATKAYDVLSPLLAENGKAQESDYYMLAVFCEEYATYVWAINDMRVNGRVQKTKTGYEQVRPAHGMASTAIQSMTRIGKELGLTIRSRTVFSLEDDVNKLSDEFKKWQRHE